MFLSVDPKHDYYLQIWKSSITTRSILQCPELVRVKYSNIRIFSGSNIHGGGFSNSKTKGNARMQLYIYSKSHSGADISNCFYNGYNFTNVTSEQLKVYNFEQAKQNVSKESNDLINTRSSSSARAYNNDQSPATSSFSFCRRNNCGIKLAPTIIVKFRENVGKQVFVLVAVSLQKYLLF